MNITVIIPTRDRMNELNRLLDSIATQTVLPNEIIILLDTINHKVLDEVSIKMQLNKWNLVYKIMPCDGIGLNNCRNLGARIATNDWLLYLDDDMILDRDYIANLIIFNKRYPSKSGYGGVISNIREKKLIEYIYDWIFDFYGMYYWDVNKVGFPIWRMPRWGHYLAPSTNYWNAHYIFGGLMCVKKDLVLKYPFIQVFNGRDPWDEVRWCWQLKKEGLMFMVSNYCKARHRRSGNRETRFKTGYKEGYNLWFNYQLLAEKSFVSFLHFMWCFLGLSLKRIVNIPSLGGLYCGLFVGFLKV